MIELFRKKYYGNINTEISYYFLINSRGAKKYYQVIYELLSDISYEYSRYEVVIQGVLKNLEKIEIDMLKYTPILYNSIKAQRRLSVIAKFALFVISENTKIPVYRLVKEVHYHRNGVDIQLSPNSFVKTAYELIPKFEKIYRS